MRRIFNDEVFKLHGSMDQISRKEMFSSFDNTKTGVMICSDVASRGLDFQNVKYVIQYDLHKEIKEYVNRIGRTARLDQKV